MEPSACSAFMPADIELASEFPVTLQTSELTEPEVQTPRARGDSALLWAQHGEAAATLLAEIPSEEGAPVPKSAEDLTPSYLIPSAPGCLLS